VANPATNLNGNGIRPVPGLDDVARDFRCAAGLPKAALLSLLLRTAAVQSSLTAQLAAIETIEELPAPTQEGEVHWLKPDEAATILRRAPRWIYRNAERLPFVKRISRKSLLCSEQGIYRWLASQKA
jgi:hypothetical protein